MPKKPNPNPWRAERDGLTYTKGSQGYYVEIPHPFAKHRSEGLHTKTEELQQAQQIAVAHQQAILELAQLVDEEEVTRRFQEQDQALQPLLPYCFGPEPRLKQVRQRVVDQWWQTLESFSVDPWAAVKTVPVEPFKFEDRQFYQPPSVAYWVPRYQAAATDPQQHYLQAVHMGRYFGSRSHDLWAVTDHDGKGYAETANILARAQDRWQLASAFMHASLHERRVEFYRNRENENDPQLPSGSDAAYALALAGLSGSGPWHHRTTETLPTLTVNDHSRYYENHDSRQGRGRFRVTNVLELVEMLAIEHCRVIQQHVLFLFVDRNREVKLDAYEDLCSDPPSDEEIKQGIRATVFEELKRQPAMQAKARQAAKSRPKPTAPSSEATVKTTPARIRVPIEPPAKAAPVASAPSKQLRVPHRAKPAGEKVQPLSKDYSYLNKLKRRREQESKE